MLCSLGKGRNSMSEKKSFLKGKEPVTFLDLFAGAGGISEGFLQSYTDEKYFDFVLASDINSNCELTHKVRYNEVLGLNTEFLCEDIMSDSFLKNLKKKIGGKQIDVITGGPSCQSFSLSGRRRKYDKRDNLFEHYLKVIREIRPKYFVMENVKGILTKDNGKFKEEIMRQILSIIDSKKINLLYDYLDKMLCRAASPFERKCILAKIHLEVDESPDIENLAGNFFVPIEEMFKRLTRGIDYQISKSSRDIATIRHGIQFLKHINERQKLKASVIQEKTLCDMDNDCFVDSMNSFIAVIEDDFIIDKIIEAMKKLKEFEKQTSEVSSFISMLYLYAMSLDECFAFIRDYACQDKSEKEYDDILNKVRLYRIHKPIVVQAANYGVPQNRERVLFIGCRNDQQLITEIPPTVSKEERVTVYEALWDLDFIGNGETKTDYLPVKKNPKLDKLLLERTVSGCKNEKGEKKLYAEWSKEGRLGHRFVFDRKPFYVKSEGDLENPKSFQEQELFNHQTSLQNEEVQKRLKIIAKHQGYTDACKEELKKKNLETNKRNYTLLNPESQSPTVVTMSDDFVHYSRHRAMTVREMARLQSFDDSFVFQGKRQTGGTKRKSEIPQYTLVGNAVPPLMAKAIGNKILEMIQ